MAPGPLTLLVLLAVGCGFQGAITGDGEREEVDAVAVGVDAGIGQYDSAGIDGASERDALSVADASLPDALASSNLLVLDATYTHDTGTMAFSFFDLPDGFPADLTSPIDYAAGTLYERLEVIDKPSDKGVTYQLCFFQDAHTSDNHACVAQSGLAFSAPGAYEYSQEMTTIWQYGVIEWQRTLLDVMLVVKDGGGHPVDTRYGFDQDWDGSPDLGLYYPMEVHYTAVIVPPGETFPGW